MKNIACILLLATAAWGQQVAVPQGGTLGPSSRLSDAATLNADQVDGSHCSVAPGANAVPVADSYGKIAGGWIPLPTSDTLGGVLMDADCLAGSHVNGIDLASGRLKCSADTGGDWSSISNKPSSFPPDTTSAAWTELVATTALKAPLADPTFTGIVNAADVVASSTVTVGSGTAVVERFYGSDAPTGNCKAGWYYDQATTAGTGSFGCTGASGGLQNGTWSAIGGGSANWGSVAGTLTDQTDLQDALDAKGIDLLSLPSAADYCVAMRTYWTAHPTARLSNFTLSGDQGCSVNPFIKSLNTIAAGDWSVYSGSVYQATIASPDYVERNGVPLVASSPMPSLAAVVANGQWFYTGGKLYVYSTSDPGTDSSTWKYANAACDGGSLDLHNVSLVADLPIVVPNQCTFRGQVRSQTWVRASSTFRTAANARKWTATLSRTSGVVTATITSGTWWLPKDAPLQVGCTDAADDSFVGVWRASKDVTNGPTTTAFGYKELLDHAGSSLGDAAAPTTGSCTVVAGTPLLVVGNQTPAFGVQVEKVNADCDLHSGDTGCLPVQFNAEEHSWYADFNIKNTSFGGLAMYGTGMQHGLIRDGEIYLQAGTNSNAQDTGAFCNPLSVPGATSGTGTTGIPIFAMWQAGGGMFGIERVTYNNGSSCAKAGRIGADIQNEGSTTPEIFASSHSERFNTCLELGANGVARKIKVLAACATPSDSKLANDATAVRINSNYKTGTPKTSEISLDTINRSTGDVNAADDQINFPGSPCTDPGLDHHSFNSSGSVTAIDTGCSSWANQMASDLKVPAIKAATGCAPVYVDASGKLVKGADTTCP